MPTYEYECPKCGVRFEEFQSMKDAPLTKCPTPKCRGKVKRLIGAGAGLLFKGSGFYITDYRSSSYKDKKKGDAPGGSSGSGGSSGTGSPPAKSDAPASKSEKPAKSPKPKSD
jgi:putative FmdB family regulatory protein